MSRAKFETIARIAYGPSIPGGWESLRDDEKDRYCEIVEEVLNGEAYDGMMHYETIAKAAAEAWDAAVEYARDDMFRPNRTPEARERAWARIAALPPGSRKVHEEVRRRDPKAAERFVAVSMPPITESSCCDGREIYSDVIVVMGGVRLREVAPPAYVPVAGINMGDLAPYISTDNLLMGVRGTWADVKVSSSSMVPVRTDLDRQAMIRAIHNAHPAGFAGAKQDHELTKRGLLCGCWECLEPFANLPLDDPKRVWWMVVCPTCGNKRCPKASHHDNACTGSNEPGQKGSVYE